MTWQQLLDIHHEQVEMALAEQATRPQACPNDGEPLQAGPDGELFCTYDGWKEGD